MKVTEIKQSEIAKKVWSYLTYTDCIIDGGAYTTIIEIKEVWKLINDLESMFGQAKVTASHSNDAPPCPTDIDGFKNYTRMKDIAIDMQNEERDRTPRARYFNNCVEPKLDRATLPNDGQKIWFQEERFENWKFGEFSEGDDFFVVSPKEWYLSTEVIKWCAVEDSVVK